MALDMERIKDGENLTTEFKREYTDEIKKAIVAFANTEGGTLYIGINDEKSIVGVDNHDDTLLQLTNVVCSAIKPDLTLFVDYETEKVGKATVIVVNVRRGTARPYYLAGKGIRPEGVYVRHGPSSVPATEAVILNMIRETDGEKYEEVQSSNQDLTFTETAGEFKLKDLEWGLPQMISLKLATTEGSFTNLGLFLSDQSPYTVKLAVFEGLEKEIFKDRREFAGSLIKQLNDAYGFLDMYNHTHAEVEGLYRNDKRDYPEDAIREALLNALVHRDYAFSSSTLISIFDDRIEFVSIGGLPKGVSFDDILLGISVARNENLANVFYRLHLIEAYGTGIPKIMRSYADCIKKPELQSTNNAFKITLPNKNTNSASRKVTGGTSFTESEEKIMKLLNRRGSIVRKDIEAALAVSQAMAVRLLRGLIDKGAIRAVGGGKKIRYVKLTTGADQNRTDA
ncbi:MAG: putative DNA binding domain-containing protein [Treponema sp.]|jgi:ATP-dependent DNA helicase RecG|nr:putative DNA binding domain-containing protein [Treponema sp.]